eukprot:672599-Amphidinium_carterae.1
MDAQEVGASTGLSEVGENCEMGDEGNKYISDEGLERAISRRRIMQSSVVNSVNIVQRCTKKSELRTAPCVTNLRELDGTSEQC